MKIAELGKATVQAELTVRRQMAIRIGRQVAFLVIAAIFGLLAVLSGHALLWAFAYQTLGFSVLGAAILVFAIDAAVAVLFLLLGRRSIMTPEEIRARFERDHAINDLRQAMALTAITSAIAGPVGRQAGRAIWQVVRSAFGRKG
ncbi:phage holin family protein [Nguyenibacter vanlangensis]|uniref:Phage holin family protein n=2 Tax=Nguyenibacter vanlangensis TaxID=1216886 RepID=A0A7Y7IT96_9PROT|nr:phage holin family protein [Nguyenibacter vanlangensis]